jgi:DUF3094 family protein
MGMRSEDEYNKEDLARINEALNEGIHSVERKPFRFSLLFLWWIVVAGLGAAAWYFAKFAGVI